MRETDYIRYTEITQPGKQEQIWKTDSAHFCVEVCRAMPETRIQSSKVLAPLTLHKQEGGCRLWVPATITLNEQRWEGYFVHISC